MIKKVNKQGKTIINKHHNNFSHLTPEQQLDMFRYFKNDEDKKTYLKGEIIIDTDPENPSIYILNNNNEVVKISGNGSGGEGSYDDTELKRLINVVSNNLDVLRGDDVNKSVRTIAEEILTNGVDLSEITENIDKLNELIGETSVKSQIDVKIGELPSDKTVVDLINEETSNRTNTVEDIQNQINVVTETYATLDNVNITKTELESKFTATQNILDNLIGDDNNKTVRNIATDEASKAVANVINGAPESFDTLQEIANWIIGGEGVSGVTAADMLISIQKNAEDIANEVAERKETVDDIKKDYLTSSDKTELSNAITAETNTRIESIDNLQSEINTIKSDYLKGSDKQELSNSINDVIDVVDNHTETILSIQDSVNTFRGDFDKNVESVDTSINNITNDINSINSELDNIDTTLENINTNISGITETIETINNEIVDIKEDVSNKHVETNSVISGITEEIGVINDNISTITTNVGNIEENLTTTTSNVDDIIDNQLPSINDSISGITTEVTNIKEEISGYTESINEISKTTNQLNEKVDDAVTNFNTLSDTVLTFENSINTNTENINTLLTNVSANTETLNVLTGDEEGSINKKIIDTKAEIDTYTVNSKLISDSPVLDSNDLNISTGYTITNVGERIIPEEQLTTAFAKLESMLLKTTLAITAALNDLESRIGSPTEYDNEGNLIKEGSGLFKRIEDLEERTIV